jgi:hypothetical protein
MPHKLLSSHNFTPRYFNIYFLIEFKFYSIIKPSIRILTHHINRKNILFYIHKHNLNKCLILEYFLYINTIIINVF